MPKIKNRVRGNDFHRALLFHSRLTARLARCLEPENQFLLLLAPTDGTTAALVPGCPRVSISTGFPIESHSFLWIASLLFVMPRLKNPQEPVLDHGSTLTTIEQTTLSHVWGE
jgi:hypothetical protein